MSEQMEVKLSFNFDMYLMYLIQDVTKKSSVDILAFFNDLARAVANIGVEKRTGSGIRKDIHNFFPGTSIPFKMLVKGHKQWNRGNYNRQTGKFEGEEKQIFGCRVEVMFPESHLYMSEEQLGKISEALMERELLGGDGMSLPNFERPDPKTPKLYKDLMVDVCGKQPIKAKKTGYDPEVNGNCRTCNRKVGTTQWDCHCVGNPTGNVPPQAK